MPAAVSAAWGQLVLLARAVCWSEVTGRAGEPAEDGLCAGRWPVSSAQPSISYQILSELLSIWPVVVPPLLFPTCVVWKTSSYFLLCMHWFVCLFCSGFDLALVHVCLVFYRSVAWVCESRYGSMACSGVSAGETLGCLFPLHGSLLPVQLC